MLGFYFLPCFLSKQECYPIFYLILIKKKIHAEQKFRTVLLRQKDILILSLLVLTLGQ